MLKNMPGSPMSVIHVSALTSIVVLRQTVKVMSTPAFPLEEIIREPPEVKLRRSVVSRPILLVPFWPCRGHRHVAPSNQGSETTSSVARATRSSVFAWLEREEESSVGEGRLDDGCPRQLSATSVPSFFFFFFFPNAQPLWSVYQASSALAVSGRC